MQTITPCTRGGPALAALALALALGPGQAAAQGSGCRAEPAPGLPSRQILRCADGLTITAEQGAAVEPVDDDRDGRTEAATLAGRAILIESPPPRRGARRPFQILTPHAIASVRGTVWAVDVTPARTSVFVREGAVSVARQATPREAVRLGPGEGVDVDAAATGGALEVKRWSPERAAALLARLGR